MVSSSSVCTKCGTTKKSGKRSCCARGGAWFKNCGDAGEVKFDHTWAEGVQVCKGFGTSVLIEPIFGRVGVIGHLTNAPPSRNVTQQKKYIYRLDSILNTDGSESQTHAGLANVDVCICVLFIISHLQI